MAPGGFRSVDPCANKTEKDITVDYQVSVVLKNGNRHNIRLGEEETAAFDASSARLWIGDAFNEADLDTPSLAGKILLMDQIMMLAFEQKPADWATPTAELKQFLAAVVKALGRPTVTIDLANYKI